MYNKTLYTNVFSIILCFLLSVLNLNTQAQVRIGSANPRGMLDVNTDSTYQRSGLVIPSVSSADTFNINPGASASTANSYRYPSVVVPNAVFSSRSITVTDDESNTSTETYSVVAPPGVSTYEAPGGTIVYDESTDGLRYKKSSRFGNWSDNIVDGTTIQDSINYRLLGGIDFKLLKASCGYLYSVAIGAYDRAVYTAGYGGSYRTGKGRTGSGSWSMILGGPAIDVSGGYYHGMAVLENGDAYAWGRNSYGRTGLGTTSGYTPSPKKITLPAGEKAVRCEAGLYNSLILTEAGNVYAAGRNQSGANGNGLTNGNQSVFTKINFPGGVLIQDIAINANQWAAALDRNGKIYTWGEGNNRQLGTGSTANQLTPVMLNTPAGVVFKIIGITVSQGFGITIDNRLFRWGYRGSEMFPGWVAAVTYVTPTEVTQFPGLFDAGENVVAAATLRMRTGDYLGGCMMFATDKGRIFASGQSNGTNTGAPDGNGSGKLGVINPDNGTRVTAVPAFTLIQDHAIYSGTQVTGIAIGRYQAIICTGINPTYPDDVDYTAYGSGYCPYLMLGPGPQNRRVFTSIKK